ncbi:hypothetical protein PTKIN_Ptkin14bG0178000 [Pterospermum kingtungense]
MVSVVPTSFLNTSSYITILTLDTNQVRVKFPADVFRFPCLQNCKIPSLVELSLNNNKLNGPIEPFDKVAPLKTVDLGNNEIYGPISSFSKFVNLIFLDLSSTKLYGNFELGKKLNKLRDLYLSNNAFISLTSRSYGNYSFPNHESLHLSSCNLSEFPNVVRNLQGLGTLDLSYNRIQMIEVDTFLKLESLSYLDLSNNSSLSVSNKSNVSLVLPYLSEFSSSCNISEVPNFLTTQDNLRALDLSNNFIQHHISEEKIKWGKNLLSVNLEKNYLTLVEYYQ